MPEATLSSKYQVTLPMEIVRALDLKGGDKLVVTLVEDQIVMLPKPADWAAYFHGRLKGVYGKTKEDVDRYIAEVRYGEPAHSGELERLLASNDLARQVLNTLIRLIQTGKHHNDHQLREAIRNARRSFTDKEYYNALTELERLGAIETVKDNPSQGWGPLYRTTETGRRMATLYPEIRD